MGTTGDLLLSLAGVVVVATAPLEVAFGALIAFWLLVPGNLQVPHAPHLVLVHRLVLYTFAVRLVVRRGGREPRRRAFAPAPVHAALVALVLIGLIVGVGVASSSDSVSADIHVWFTFVDLLVLFVTVLAVARTISPRKTVNIIVPVVMAAVGIGLIERWLHHGWAHFFFEGVPAQDVATGSNPLQVRDGHVRAQGAAQFALEYGWVIVMLLPLVIYAAMRWVKPRWRWTRLAWLMPLAAFVAVVFSGSRIAEIAAVVVTVLFVLLAGADRQLATWGLGALLIGVIVALSDPSFITSPFSTLSSTDPASVRLDRLPPLFALIVHRPFTGLGFTGISSLFGGLDDAYALLYARLGVIGILAWLVVIVVAAASTARSLRAPRGSETRMLGTACLIGILVVGVGGTMYDLVDTPQSTWTLVVLAALGTAVAQQVPRNVIRRRWAARLLLPIAGMGIGFAVLAAAPVSSSESFSIFTVAPWVIAYQGAVYPWKGMEMVNTLCPVVTNIDTLAPGTSVNCLQGSNIFPTDYPGLALITVRAPTAAAVKAEVRRAFAPIFRYMPMEGGPSETIQTGRPSWAVTAPLSGGVAGLMAMFLWPPLRSRRRRSLRDGERENRLGDPEEPQPVESQMVGAGV